MMREEPRALEQERRNSNFCGVKEGFTEVSSQLNRSLPSGEMGKAFKISNSKSVFWRW